MGQRDSRWGAGHKRDVTVQQILEWAFRRECVSLELPDHRPAEERGFGFGMEYVLMQRARLGGVRIDTSVGTSSPHEDAETVAAVLGGLSEALGGKRMAIKIAELSRAALTPDWMPGAVPQFRPVEWRTNRYGSRAATEVVGVERVQRGNRVVEVEVRFCPVTIAPTQQQIGAARREYLLWRLALLDLRTTLQSYVRLSSHVVTDGLPPIAPWNRGRPAEKGA